MNEAENKKTTSYTEPPKTQAKPKKKTEYLNNRDLLAEVIRSKEKGAMTHELAVMLNLLTTKYAKRANFANYTYIDDMRGYAMLMLAKTWNSFNPQKSENPFAFFTQCIKRSFFQYLNYEKRQRTIRDEILINVGMSPSLNYQMEHENDYDGYDDQMEFTPSALTSFVGTSSVKLSDENIPIAENLEENFDIPDDLPTTGSDELEV